MKVIWYTTALCLLVLVTAACEGKKDSDRKQTAQQETILAEATAQVGMPAIVNFRERKLLKDIYELRDQTALVTYTYLVAEQTAALVFFCTSMGYGVPYATQFTSPQKLSNPYSEHYVPMPQADPNGLFSPAVAEGTWVLCKDPKGPDVRVVYVEPRVVVSPFPLGPGGP